MLHFSITDDQKKLQEKARKFAIEEVLPVAWNFDIKNDLPVDVIKKADKAGLMNGDIPKQYGGKGLSLVDAALITEEISAACPGIATSMFDNSLGYEPIIFSNKEHIKEKYLPKIANEGKFICFATSEPTMGSDVSSIKCKAVQDGEGYRLTGTKYWITNGGIADYITVFATVDSKKKHEGICAFLVERGWEGVSIGKHIPKLGQRTSNTTAVNLKNVFVPKENILAEPGKGFALAMRTFSRTRPIIGAFAVGAARSAFEYALDYIKKRRAFGFQIMNFQITQKKIAEMYQKIETSRLLVWKAAWESDSGIDPTLNASIAKFYATEAAMEVVNDALQLFGGYGYTKMFPIEKLFRDTRLLTIYEGTSEVQRIIVSGFLLGNYKPIMPTLEELPIPGNNAIDTGEKQWRCRMCGHVHLGDEAPNECSYCFFPKTAFVEIA